VGGDGAADDAAALPLQAASKSDVDGSEGDAGFVANGTTSSFPRKRPRSPKV
jgi:hypothetical protein